MEDEQELALAAPAFTSKNEALKYVNALLAQYNIAPVTSIADAKFPHINGKLRLVSSEA
jgi:hypothetical protein